jgi:hypothetical protein
MLMQILTCLVPCLYMNGWFDRFNMPINERLFGCNKKWRGLISLPLINGILCTLYASLVSMPCSGLLLGVSSGFFWNIFELPNSFVKRCFFSIGPGDGDKYWATYIIDHLDSTIGVVVLLYFFYEIPMPELFNIVGISMFLHWINHLIRKRFEKIQQRDR